MAPALGQQLVPGQARLEALHDAREVRRQPAEADRRGLDVALQQAAQVADAGAAGGGDLDHRHAELLLERPLVDADAPRLGGIHHVERQNHRAADLEHLQREVEIAVEVGRVHHEDDQVGRRGVGLQAQQHVAHDDLVGRPGTQAVAAGQVEQLDAASGGERADPELLLHRDARVVGDLLPQSRERVEQRRLARIRVAEDRDSPPDRGTAGRALVERQRNDRRGLGGRSVSGA